MIKKKRARRNTTPYSKCPRCQAMVPNSSKRRHLYTCGHNRGVIKCHVCDELVPWGDSRKHSRSHNRPHAAPYKLSIKFTLSAEALAKARAVAIAEEGNGSWKACRDVVNRIILKYEIGGRDA